MMGRAMLALAMIGCGGSADVSLLQPEQEPPAVDAGAHDSAVPLEQTCYDSWDPVQDSWVRWCWDAGVLVVHCDAVRVTDYLYVCDDGGRD